MKPLLGNFVKDYLTFSKKERNGIFIILLLSVFVYFIFRYFPIHRPHPDNGAFQKELAQLRISIDTSHNAYAYRQEEIADLNQPTRYNNYNRTKGELFEFDPNTLNAAGWKRLGLREKTINTIHNFLAKGYRFKKADDIRKIYGLRSVDADRLVTYVRIPEKEVVVLADGESHHYPAFSKKPDETTSRASITDINHADTSEFISLPGIGSKLAARIVNFREKLGGFNSVTQLGETYGIPDSTFQKIKVRLKCDNPQLKKININTTDANELRVHPYIKWNIANAIINYRNQHGSYKSLNDLRKIEIISDDVFNKIAPYLVL